jgi:hypothetical protein
VDQERFEAAIRSYWVVRELQKAKQLESGRVDAGLRGAVTGGAHLDALAQLLEEIFLQEGFPAAAIRRRTNVELPGFFRPTKRWDLVVVDKGRLVAAVEFKSQVGPSFGNNFNNRIEEALGNAVDLWKAYEQGNLGSVRPWLGYVFLLEEHPKSISPVSVANTAFQTDPEFDGTSYKERYRLLCRRLVYDRLYDAACFVTATNDVDQSIHEPDRELSFASFVRAITDRAEYIRSLDLKASTVE